MHTTPTAKNRILRFREIKTRSYRCLILKNWKISIVYSLSRKSPHGCDVDPTGEYIVRQRVKLLALIPVFSFDKIQKAIAEKAFEDYDGVPVIKYDAALHGEVKKPASDLCIQNWR